MLIYRRSASLPTQTMLAPECLAQRSRRCVRAHVGAPSASHSLRLPQFVESKYHIELNAAAASQLNRAIASGSDKGIFSLPKGELLP